MSPHSESPADETLSQSEPSPEVAKCHLEVEYTGGGPLSIKLPTDTIILQEARRFAVNRDSSLNDFATCVSQDPVIVLEMLRVSNSTIIAQERPPITLAKNAVIQLGMARVLEIIDELASRQSPTAPEVHEELEKLRSRARRSSILARILAMTHHRDLAPEAQTAGLMVELGHMIACLYFGTSYAQTVHQISRGTLNYRLQHDQHFDVKKVQMSYLRRMGFPEALLFALDRETQCKTPHRIAMRHIVESAAEMVEAFDTAKWHKFEPGKNLPVNSSLRLLRFDELQYQRVWERCNEYLRLAQEEERVRHAALTAAPPASVESTAPAVETAAEQMEQADQSAPAAEVFDNLAADASMPQGNDPSNETTLRSQALAAETPKAVKSNLKSTPDLVEDPFVKLLFPTAPPPQFQDNASTPMVKPHLNSKRAQAALSALCGLCESIENTSDLLEEIIVNLIGEGPFVRAAVFVVSENRRSAAVLRAAGNDLIAGTEVAFSDPTNPLAICMQQVRSFNNGGVKDLSAPLGISSYAVAPINVRHNTPVFLYADCGSERSMTFEARKLFRYVVGLLNSTLPNIDGDLPS